MILGLTPWFWTNFPCFVWYNKSNKRRIFEFESCSKRCIFESFAQISKKNWSEQKRFYRYIHVLSALLNVSGALIKLFEDLLNPIILNTNKIFSIQIKYSNTIQYMNTNKKVYSRQHCARLEQPQFRRPCFLIWHEN